MLSKLKKLSKSKLGEAIDAIIITPIWIFVIVIIGVQVQLRQAKQEVEDAAQVSTRYIMLAETLDEAIGSVNNYLHQRSDRDYFYDLTIDNITMYKVTISGSNKTYQKIAKTAEYTAAWESGNLVEFTLKRKTPFSESSLFSLCPPAFVQQGNDDICVNLLQENVWTRTSVIIM